MKYTSHTHKLTNWNALSIVLWLKSELQYFITQHKICNTTNFEINPKKKKKNSHKAYSVMPLEMQ
jgi:hypothetical protein